MRILGKALAWGSKPTEQSFPELPEVLVRDRRCGVALGRRRRMSFCLSHVFLLVFSCACARTCVGGCVYVYVRLCLPVFYIIIFR